MPAITNVSSIFALPAAMPTTATATATAATTLTNLQAILSAANASASVVLGALQQRLQKTRGDSSDAGDEAGAVADMGQHSNVASIILSNFLPTSAVDDVVVAEPATATQVRHIVDTDAPSFVSPLSIESLVASSAEDLSSNFRDLTFDIFDDDDDLFGSPLAFDASENGLWNGRFVPPPPRPPFFVDEPVLSDGLTTCDLCSWAMPTKSTFIFEGTIEKASELGWPLTLIIVSILSALVGAIIMITVVRCRRKKASNNRNETHVQWWSRHKRPHSGAGISGVAGHINNNNHLRRSNIYTAHPADSIRGMGQPSLSAASSLTAMTAMGVSASIASVPPPPAGPASAPPPPAAATPTPSQSQQQQQQQQYYHSYPHHQQQHQHHHYHHPHQHLHQLQQHHRDYDDYEHEYHQPQELHRTAAATHQRRHSSTSSISSEAASPSLAALKKGNAMLPVQLHQPREEDAGAAAVACRWSNATMMMAS